MSQEKQNSIALTVMTGLALAAFVWALSVGINKEIDRLEIVAADTWQTHGQYMEADRGNR